VPSARCRARSAPGHRPAATLRRAGSAACPRSARAASSRRRGCDSARRRCGLRWVDIDLDAKTLTITENRVTVDGVPVDSEPKTQAGRRTLPLTDSLVTVLRRAKRRHAAERLTAGALYVDSGYLVVNEIGHRLHPDTVSDRWNQLAVSAGVRRIRLHDARHTCGTLMHLEGVPTAVIAAWLGHSSPAFTMRTYVHSQPEALQSAADVLGLVTFL